MDENRDREQAELDAREDLELRDEEASGVRGGYKQPKSDGSLDAGVQVKYDIKAQKEG